MTNPFTSREDSVTRYALRFALRYELRMRHRNGWTPGQRSARLFVHDDVRALCGALRRLRAMPH